MDHVDQSMPPTYKWYHVHRARWSLLEQTWETQAVKGENIDIDAVAELLEDQEAQEKTAFI